MQMFIKQQKPKLFSVFLALLCTAFIASAVLAESETPEETLVWCGSLASDASEQAFQAQVTCDYPTAYQALSLANEAAYLAAKATKEQNINPLEGIEDILGPYQAPSFTEELTDLQRRLSRSVADAHDALDTLGNLMARGGADKGTVQHVLNALAGKMDFVLIEMGNMAGLYSQK